MWETIGAVIFSGILGFARNWWDKRVETDRLKIQNETQIKIAEIEATNSESVRKVKIEKLLSEHTLQIQKMFGKTSNKFLDNLKGIIGIWVMTGCTGVGIVMLLDPELRMTFCEYFLMITVMVISYFMGGSKIPTIPRIIRR